MRFTIERLRTLVLAAGVLLVIALGVFLATAKFRNRFIRKDIPHALGHGIQEEANGFKYEHYAQGHLLYRIRASKQIQLKQDGKTLLRLHDVNIELYAEDGSRVDRIAGDEFEYNPTSGIARATGPVEITLMKPTVAPAIAPRAKADQPLKQKNLAAAAQTASRSEIEVKTSGLSFDRNTGEASTTSKVQFSIAQGAGSAVGARYDAHAGQLVLDRDVQLNVQRGAEAVKLIAQHAVFNRDEQACEMQAATMRYGNDESSAQQAKVYFRSDGSAERLIADKGLSVATAAGGHLAAPRGLLEFDEHTQPDKADLDGGVTIDSNKNGRIVHGTSPKMRLVFGGKGELRSAHLERGVQIASDEQSASAGSPLRTHREWKSPVVDIAFRSAGRGRIEPASIHGTGGVVVTGSIQRGSGPVVPERLSADEVTGQFGGNGTLTMLTGRGKTTVEETSTNGARQSMSGDVLIAHLGAAGAGKDRKGTGGAGQIESATVDGHVMLSQQSAAKRGEPQSTLQASAGHADFENEGQWLHLTESPRVTDGGLELTAEKLNVSQESGDAFAIGNVKATWTGEPKQDKTADHSAAGASAANFGAQGPSHVVAEQAQLKRSGMATFKGNARLWQEGNSVTAPMIVLDRTKQTLVAQTTNAQTPVQVVLVSATAVLPGEQGKGQQNGPSVVQLQGGDLKYSAAERKAVMHAGVVGQVSASTADGKTTSTEFEMLLAPPGNHAGKGGEAAQVERMTSTGHVVIWMEGRRGTGEKLVYTGETGKYVLTGTAADPPRLTDPAHGTVTGQALIFNSRDDSVSVEGDGRRTTTVTRAPK